MKRSILAIAIAALLLACGSGDEKRAASAEAEAPDVAAEPADAVTRCLALAAKENWTEALTPCTQAAQESPDDLRIKHAVQQAQAAGS